MTKLNANNSKRVWNLGSFSVSAHAFVSVKNTDVRNAIFEYFNIKGDGHREYAILNTNNRTVLIEARSGYQKPSDGATEVDHHTAYMINNMTYETIPSIIAEILK